MPQAAGHNPLCGDKLDITLRMQGDRLEDLRFEGQGCAISTASASLMSEAVKGRSRAGDRAAVRAGARAADRADAHAAGAISASCWRWPAWPNFRRG